MSIPVTLTLSLAAALGASVAKKITPIKSPPVFQEDLFSTLSVLSLPL